MREGEKIGHTTVRGTKPLFLFLFLSLCLLFYFTTDADADAASAVQLLFSVSVCVSPLSPFFFIRATLAVWVEFTVQNVPHELCKHPIYV